jgi:hypothetical protein
VRRLGAVLVTLACIASRANADDQVVAHAPAPAQQRHTIYVELLGKAGLWGVGYDFLLHRRVAVGATASFLAHDNERVVTFSPYVAVYPVGVRHRWFVEAGPQLVHLSQMSPVPEWPGQQDTGVGAEVGSGYELRGRVVFRAFGMATVGKRGASPWVGLSLGVAL